MSAGRHARPHQSSPLGIRRADELVVEVDAGARGLRDDLERAGDGWRMRACRCGRGGQGAGHRHGALRESGARRRLRRQRLRLGARRRRCGDGGRSRDRLRRGLARDGGRRGRGCDRGRSRQSRRQLLRARRQPAPLIGGFAAPLLGALERGARAGKIAQLQIGLGQAQVGVVALLDIGAISDDVAARLRTLAGRLPQQARGAHRLALRERLQALAVGLVPLRGRCNTGRPDDREHDEQPAEGHPANTRARATPRQRDRDAGSC
jgi:hypothetical protein